MFDTFLLGEACNWQAKCFDLGSRGWCCGGPCIERRLPYNLESQRAGGQYRSRCFYVTRELKTVDDVHPSVRRADYP